MRTWMAGRTVTGAHSKLPILPVSVHQLIGRTIERVEPNGKHLLIHLSGDLVLQTHMRMTGSWHLYSADAVWKRPKHQATLVIEAGGRVAVGFNIPIVSLDTEAWMKSTPSLRSLGSDILSASFDIDDVLLRIARQPSDRAWGDVLLDQRVVAGIGNIYRCEALFVCRHHPRAGVGALDDAARRRLISTAQTLMRANLGSEVGRNFGLGLNEPNVYRRAGRACFVCSTAIESEVQGTQARRAYWCPRCQVRAALIVD
jgi:endonuclease VIII